MSLILLTRIKMETPAIKYEYRTIGIPSAALKHGETAIITRVTFYNDKDYVRGKEINIDMSIPVVQEAMRESGHPKAVTLESCTDEQLALLSSHKIGYSKALPLEELMQLRELEKYLRATVGNYRSLD